jgi:hypothetical protein
MSERVDGEAALVSGGTVRVGGNGLQLRRNRLRLGLVLLVSLVGLLSVGVGSASAVTTTPACDGGGTFTITDNVVTGNTSCAGTATIPNTVTSIGYQAFNMATGLTTVAFQATSQVTTIGGSAFRDASNLTSITIPNSVTSIGDLAFYAATSLTSVTFEAPSRVTTIGFAFQGATSLASIAIPSSVNSLSNYVLSGTTSLASITVDAANPNYKDIDGVLYNKAGSTLIQYPVGNTRTDYTLPSSVTNIGSGFSSAANLTNITVDAANPNYKDIDGVLYNKAGSTLIQYPARNSRTDYTLPSSVTDIGSGFSSAANLTSITVDAANPSYKGVDGVLFDTTGATLIAYPVGSPRTSYETPSSVTSIGYNAFSGASGLTTVTIGSGVTSISSYAFNRTTSLVRFNFEGVAAPPTVEMGAFGFSPPTGATAYRFAGSTGFTTSGSPAKWNGLLVADYIAVATPPAPVAVAGVESATITVAAPSVGPTPTSYLVTANPGTATCTVTGASGSCPITGLTGATTYTFTAVAKTASPDLTSLASAASNGVTPTAAPVVTITPCTTGTFTITDNVITGNTSCAGTATIPNTVTSIASTAFQSATGLTTVTFEATSQVATIGNQAFLSASGLSSITIPASVTTIGTGAFGGTSSLTSISVDGANPNYKDTDGVVFSKNGTTLVAYPSGSARTAYTTPSTVTSIYGDAFRFARRLTSVTIGSGVTTIGDDAFRGSSGLTSVTIGSGVATIGNSAFFNATSLVRVYFEVPIAPTVGANPFNAVPAGATAYRFVGSTGFTTPTWNGLLVANYVAAPPAPVAVAEIESATITVAAPAVGPTPTSYLVTANPGVATCTVTGASGSCLITGLTAATTYTFTAVAKTASPDLTSLASAASNEVAPTAAPVVVPDTPVVVTTALADTTVSPAPVSSTGAPMQTPTGLKFMFTANQPGTIWLQLKSTSTRSTHRATPVICTTTKRITKAGKLTLNCPYTKAARQLLAKGALAVTSTTTFTPTVGTATTTTSALTLKRLRIATPRPIAKPTTPSSVTG